jgi:hypothetical protein
MIYEHKRHPELSWSFSRIKLLKECEKKYYMNYYGSYDGWCNNSSEDVRRLYRLKCLQPMNALFGEIFHRTVQYTINNYDSENISPDIFYKKLHEILATKYRESKNCIDKWMTYPKKYTMISELYYETDLTKEQGNRIRKKIEVCSNNIFKSRSFQEIINNDIKLKEMEELQHFMFNGIKVYVKLDTLFQVNQYSKWIIVDWKTSSRPLLEDEEQMLFYAYYVSKIHHVEPEKIESRLEYIFQDSSKVYTFSKRDFELVEAKLNNDLKVMKAYLIDEEENIPKLEVDFQQNKSRMKCSHCNYREVCYESKQGKDSYSYKVVGIEK